MKRGVFLNIIIVVTLISCNNSNIKNDGNFAIFDVESNVGKGRVVNLSEIATNIRYIPLETNRSSVVGSPVVLYENGRIYIRSLGKTKVFDTLGKYLFTFDRRGRGPEEYSYASNPTIVGYSGDITVTERKGDSTILKYYSRDGIFIKDISVPNPNNNFLANTVVLNPNLYIVHVSNSLLRPERKNIAILFDSLSNLIGFVPKPVVKMKRKKNDVRTIVLGNKTVNIDAGDVSAYLKISRDKIKVYSSMGDTIYAFEKGELKPEYALFYGKYKKENYVIPQNPHEIAKDFINISNFIYFETVNLLLIEFNLRGFAHEPYIGGAYIFGNKTKRTTSLALFNKVTKEFTIMNQPVKGCPGFRENLMSGPPFNPHHLSYDGHIASIYYPGTLISYASKNTVSEEFKKMVAGLKETDNPVVAIAKLK
ncbi:MAG: 6-bladed beta-propeller [Bacteroidales bacterium]